MAIYTAACGERVARGERVKCGNLYCSMWRKGEVWQSILQDVEKG